jgi:hypothetical protein
LHATKRHPRFSPTFGRENRKSSQFGKLTVDTLTKINFFRPDYTETVPKCARPYYYVGVAGLFAVNFVKFRRLPDNGFWHS